MIYFSNFGGALGGDVTIAVQNFLTPTVTGTDSVTNSSLTGITPKAALVVGTYHLTANDATETAGEGFSFAALDGTRQTHAHVRTRDAFGQTTGGCSNATGEAYRIVSGTGTVEKAASGSLVSGGVSLNYTTASASVIRGSYIAFAGADCSAYTGSVALGTGTSAIDVTAPGFEPDAVIFFGFGLAFPGSSTTAVSHSLGVALSDGTQRSILSSELMANAAGGNPRQALLTTRAGGRINATTGALDYHLTASAFDASGFSVTPSASTGSAAIGYLALSFGSRRCSVVDLTTPTTTGNHAITGAGFTPRAALVFLTNLEAVDPGLPVSADDLAASYSVSMIADNTAAHSVRRDNGADPTDTGSLSSTDALLGGSALDCDAIQASFVSFDSNGMTLNYSAVQGTAKKGFILFIE